MKQKSYITGCCQLNRTYAWSAGVPPSPPDAGEANTGLGPAGA